MTASLSGPGVGLPIPQYLYPTELSLGLQVALDVANNELTLPPGGVLPLPRGPWIVTLDGVGLVQFLDPIMGIWRGFESARNQMQRVESDGYNVRLANMTGCAIAALVQNGGTLYKQATATVTASAGNSVWQPIVGGQLSVISVGSAGSGYGKAPLLLLPAPPAATSPNAPAINLATAPLGGIGGVQATGYCTISAGTVSGVTLTNVGAGYPSIPTNAAIVPDPSDPNLGVSAIVNATVVLGLAGAGQITACLCVNPGTSVSAAPTLTPAGTTGTAATIAAVFMQTVTGGSVSTGGFGFASSTEMSTLGGVPSQTAVNINPAIELNTYRPRKASVGLTVTAGSITAIGTVYDGGLFTGTPTPLIMTNGTPTSTAPSVFLTLGATLATLTIQPAP